MNNQGRNLLGNPSATGEEVRQVIEQAVNEALEDHRRDGDPIAVWDWEQERVLMVPPDEIVVEEEQVVLPKNQASQP